MPEGDQEKPTTSWRRLTEREIADLIERLDVPHYNRLEFAETLREFFISSEEHHDALPKTRR